MSGKCRQGQDEVSVCVLGRRKEGSKLYNHTKQLLNTKVFSKTYFSRSYVLLGRKVTTNLDSIFKSRHYFANKGLSSQGYGFSCGHVWV